MSALGAISEIAVVRFGHGASAPLPILKRRGCGKITRRAEFRLTCRANQRYQLAPSFPGKRGVSRSSRTREGMRWTRQRRRVCVRRASSLVSGQQRAGRTAPKPGEASLGEDGLLRTAKPCGPGTRCWCQVAGGEIDPTGFDFAINPAVTVTRRIRRRGEHGISRKTIAQGMPACSDCTCMLVCASFMHFAHETAGAASTRRSLRPPLLGAKVFPHDLGASRRGIRKARLRFEIRHCEERSDEAIHTFVADRWIASLRSQ
jgi:hypothetical protein